jgi:chemotaxis protein histidine kinase CheA
MNEDTGDAKRARLQRILENTKRVYLQDAQRRAETLRERLQEYGKDSKADQASLTHLIYQHAHALKGVALTVGLQEIHELSEQLIAYSIQQEEAWTEESILHLVRLLQQLDEAVNQAADALT